MAYLAAFRVAWIWVKFYACTHCEAHAFTCAHKRNVHMVHYLWREHGMQETRCNVRQCSHCDTLTVIVNLCKEHLGPPLKFSQNLNSSPKRKTNRDSTVSQPGCLRYQRSPNPAHWVLYCGACDYMVWGCVAHSVYSLSWGV